MVKAKAWLQIGNTTIGGDDAQEIEADRESASNPNGVTVPAESTNYEIDWAFTLANAKAYGIVANQDCTVKTNSTGSPQETLTLKAGQALVWRENDPATMHFLAGNLTKIYVTCDAETNIKFGDACDITPA